MRELAGREHDWSAYDSLSLLIVRTMSGNPNAPLPLVARAVRAAATRDGPALRRLQAEPDPWGGSYTLWSVAALAENPQAARLLGEPMLSPTKTPGDRQLLRSALGGADLAAGRWREGLRDLADAREDALSAGASHEADHLLWVSAACAALPALPIPPPRLAEIRDEIARWQPGAEPPSEIPNPTLALRPHIRFYLLGLLDLRLARISDATKDADALDALSSAPGAPVMAARLALVLRASVASQRGQHDLVLSFLDRSRGELPATYEALHFVDIHTRWLRAEALRAARRDVEALRWYRAATQGIEYGGAPALALMGPSLLRQGELLERRGDSTAAEALYARFADLWADADPEARVLVRSAAERAHPSRDTRSRTMQKPREPAQE